MCLGVPGQIIEIDHSHVLAAALVDFGGIRRWVCVECVPDAVAGDYVIVHAGVAISRIDAIEARRVAAILGDESLE